MEHRQVLESDPADTRYTPVDGSDPVVDEVVETVVETPHEVAEDVEAAEKVALDVLETVAEDGGISTAEAEVLKDAVEEVAEAAKPAKRTRTKKAE